MSGYAVELVYMLTQPCSVCRTEVDVFHVFICMCAYACICVFICVHVTCTVYMYYVIYVKTV